MFQLFSKLLEGKPVMHHAARSPPTSQPSQCPASSPGGVGGSQRAGGTAREVRAAGSVPQAPPDLSPLPLSVDTLTPRPHSGRPLLSALHGSSCPPHGCLLPSPGTAEPPFLLFHPTLLGAHSAGRVSGETCSFTTTGTAVCEPRRGVLWARRPNGCSSSKPLEVLTCRGAGWLRQTSSHPWPSAPPSS